MIAFVRPSSTSNPNPKIKRLLQTLPDCVAVNILKLFTILGISIANIIAYAIVTFLGVDSP